MSPLEHQPPTPVPEYGGTIRPKCAGTTLLDNLFVLGLFGLLLPPGLVIAGLCIGPELDAAIRPPLRAYVYAPLALAVAAFALAPLAAYIKWRFAAAAPVTPASAARKSPEPSPTDPSAQSRDEPSTSALNSIVRDLRTWPRYQQLAFVVAGAVFLRVLYLMQDAAGNFGEPTFTYGPGEVLIVIFLWLAYSFPALSGIRIRKASSPALLIFGALLFAAALAQLFALRRYGAPALNQIDRIAFLGSRGWWLGVLSLIYWTVLGLPISLIAGRHESTPPPPPPAPEHPHHPEPRTGVP